jgi:hypothetical protein
MSNDSVFSGLTPYSGRDIASALGGMETTAEQLPDLIGAVMSLALTVDQLERSLRAINERLGPAVRVPTGAHALSSATVDALRQRREVERQPEPEPDGYMTPTHRLRLLLLGLAELQHMISYSQAMGGNANDTLTTVAVRLSALRSAHEDAVSNPPV